MVELLKKAGCPLEEDPTYDPIRKPLPFPEERLSPAEVKERLNVESPEQLICRCEQVTESEILQAIHRPVGAKTLDAVKRRVRAGMGRCQGGFCSPHVIEIIARELGIPEEEVRKRGEKAFMLSK